MIRPGSHSAHLSGFQDVLPTLAELIGVPAPPQCSRISFLPTLLGKKGKQQQHDYLYWEFCKGPKQVLFSQALRQGKWKAYLQTGKAMELFNLDADPFEKQDLAYSKEPARNNLDFWMPSCTASLAASQSPNPHCSPLHLRFGSIGATQSTAHLNAKMSNLFLADP